MTTDNLEQFKIGDHIKALRLGYSHHGLYLGNDEVIHYVGLEDGFVGKKHPIAITSIDKFALGDTIQMVPHNEPLYNTAESIERATSKIGEDKYNILFNNCEHFINWCIEGEKTSSQVKTGIWATTTIAVTGAIYFIAKVFRK